MLLALETAVTNLLEGAFPALFTGAAAAKLTYPADSWDFDPLSADPVAGEPGVEDAVDALAFNPAAPGGPYVLTRPPYAGAKRVYLHTSAGDLVALGAAEVHWDPVNPAAFALTPRPALHLADFDKVQILYGIVAAATRLKTVHKLTLLINAGDGAAADRALSLALAALALNRDTLMRDGGFSVHEGSYQADGTVKTLKLTAGAATADTERALYLEAEIDLRVERMLGADEGKPIRNVLSPGRTPGTRPVDIEPVVQA